MTERWDEAKQKTVKAAFEKELLKVAKKLGAASCMGVAFFQDPMDPEVFHMMDAGKCIYMPHQVYGRLAELNRGSEQLEILKDRRRSRTRLARS